MLRLRLLIKTILKNKMLSGLNILNLIIAYSGIIILTLYVSYEKSFDNFHEHKSSVYRIDSPLYGSHLPLPIRRAIENKFPEVEDITTLFFENHAVSTEELQSQDIKFQAAEIVTDESFFSLFSFPLVLGNKENILSKPNTTVLTQTLSRKLFGQGNPIGKSIVIGENSYSVEGVIEDFPKNSSFQADILTSFATRLSLKPRRMYGWSEWNYNIFVKLKQHTNQMELVQKISELQDIDGFTEEMNTRFPDMDILKFSPLEKIHFIKDDGNYSYINEMVLDVLILLIVVLIVMGIFNFINFSTALAPLKAKSLSVYRIMGSKRIAAMNNVVVESIILSLFAMFFAFIIYELSYSGIQNLFSIEGLSLSGRNLYILWFILFALAIAIIAAIYPSVYITSPSLSQTVKGNAFFKNKGKGMRNSIIFLQFVLTIVLIVSAITIEKQLSFWNNFDMGINKEQVVYFKLNQNLREKWQTLEEEIAKINGVQDYTFSQSIPGQVGMGWGRYIDDKYVNLKAWPVDDKFLEFFGIEIIEGRKFLKNSQADINTFIINEKAKNEFEWEHPIGKKFGAVDEDGTIIGVAKDFNFASLKETVQPMLLWLTNTRKYNLLIRVQTDNYKVIFNQMHQVIESIDPAYKTDIFFLDDSLNKLYSREQNTGRFIEFVALWCILLALTGLTGLVIFIARDRIKEIGVRRVNGANISEILLLFNSVFFKWIVGAFVVACPIAYYALNQWLESFAYRTELSWWIFAAAGATALGLAVVTVTWQSWKAATRNPVEALRYE